MKNIIITLFLSFVTFYSWAKDVTISQALNTAQTHVATEKNLTLTSVSTSLVGQKNYSDNFGNQHVAYYVVQINQNNGFVFVSGDDKTVPIIGYTDKGVYDYAKLPNGLKKLLFNVAKEVKYIATNQHLTAPTSIQKRWSNLKSGIIVPSTKSSVSPLTTTTWSQSSGGYNLFCPGGTPTGCVATATSQIMKYHNHPVTGNGSHSYNHNDYGTLSANFGATTYEWSIMPNHLTSSSTQAEKEAIAKLMYHVGVSLDMNYSPGNSGAFSRLVPDALVNYFSYDNSAQFIKRSHYSLTSWKAKIKSDLDNALVVYHSGFCPSPQAGHAFVLDGYDVNDKFHVNWGWGGYADGYFEINNLNPGSTYTFNNTQSAIIKIKPVAQNTDVRMFGNITLSSPSIPFNAPFTVSADIANYGNLTYNGSVKASLYNLNDAFVGNIEIKNNIIIPANDYVSLTFTTNGLSVPPGDYKLGIYIQNATNSNWVLAAEDGFTNPLNVSVNGINPQGLLSNGNILVNPSPIEKDNPFTVEFEILNNNTIDFSGDISIDLHQVDGTWVTEIDHGSYTIAANGTQTIVYNHAGLSQDPGTYKLVIWHKPNGGTWEIIENGNYPNSVDVDIVGLNYTTNLPDAYENNNQESSAYAVPLAWLQDQASFQTVGANVHSVTADSNDYYKIDLDAGYSYRIYAKVKDSYNSPQGMFTNDVIFKVKNDGVWSDFYDDEEMDTLSIPFLTADASIYVDVVPFFYNSLGTYQLDIWMERAGAVGVFENKDDNITLYPNPANTFVNVNHFGTNLKSITITNSQGKIVHSISAFNGEVERINTTDLAQGIYFVRIETENQAILNKKIIIKK